MAHAYNSALGGQGRWIMRSGVQDQPDQYDETLSLLKIQKLAEHGGTHLWSQLLRSLRQENHWNPVGRGCGELIHITALQNGQQEWNSVSKNKTKFLKSQNTTKNPILCSPSFSNSLPCRFLYLLVINGRHTEKRQTKMGCFKWSDYKYLHEELWTICILPSVGHWQEKFFVVFNSETLVYEK